LFKNSIIAGVLLLSLLMGCTPKSEPAASTTGTILPSAYMDASSALSIDDFDKAREALIALAKASAGFLQTKALAAANSKDIAAMRESFKSLTEEVAVHMTFPDDHAIAFCPMYKGGSRWIQKREAPIANPYFGKAMPTCGSFVD
jgi:hypothetical protein